MIKRVIQIVLGLVIIGLIYVLYEQVMTPIRFQKEVDTRSAAVVNRIKDIRLAEQAFKQKYQRYTGDFDSLINFVLNDSLSFDRTIGSKDDSVAVARGLVRTEIFQIPAIDTIFRRTVTPDEVRQLPLIPYGEGARYILNAGLLTTESQVVVPVFECAAPFKTFLMGIDEQELINLIDEAKNTYGRYPGIKVGDLTQATNDAGNWE